MENLEQDFLLKKMENSIMRRATKEELKSLVNFFFFSISEEDFVKSTKESIFSEDLKKDFYQKICNEIMKLTDISAVKGTFVGENLPEETFNSWVIQAATAS